MIPRFGYHRPRTVKEALEIKQRVRGSRFIAGGTDLLVRIKDRLERPEALVSLRRVPELLRIEANGARRIGAAVTIETYLRHPAARRHSVLAEALASMGSVQIRNSATLAGNLCNASPCADGATALLVLDARVAIAGPGGEREIPLDEFFKGPRQTVLGPDDILATVMIPPSSADARSRFLKKTRVAMDLALASVAVRADVDGGGTWRNVRVAAGAVAPTPLRLRNVESLLEGQHLTPDLASRAEELSREGIAPICDLRASADYRRHVVGVFVRRALESLAGQGKS